MATSQIQFKALYNGILAVPSQILAFWTQFTVSKFSTIYNILEHYRKSIFPFSFLQLEVWCK